MHLFPKLITTSEEKVRLGAFAASFNHKIDPRCRDVMAIANQFDNYVGYVQLMQGPLIIPAVHYSATPREALEVTQLILGWARMQYGSAMLGLPDGNKFDKKLKDCGCVPQDLRVWMTD